VDPTQTLTALLARLQSLEALVSGLVATTTATSIARVVAAGYCLDRLAECTTAELVAYCAAQGISTTKSHRRLVLAVSRWHRYDSTDTSSDSSDSSDTDTDESDSTSESDDECGTSWKDVDDSD
jgi:hypothetical protein